MPRGRRDGRALEALASRQVLFMFEGTAEQHIVRTLCEEDMLVVLPDRAVRSRDGGIGTRIKNVRDIQREFLGIGYPEDLLIARIYDVNPGKFELGKMYVPPLGTTLVADFLTTPEVEALILVREGEWARFEERGGSERRLNASDWCIQKLGLSDVKTLPFQERYWDDAEVLATTIRAYTRLLGGRKSDCLRLSDLLK